MSLTGKVEANQFVPDNANLSPFMQRLARAHLTDPLALWLLAARIVQSLIHLASLSAIAVMLRFTAFAVQLIISVYWSWKLLA